MENIYFSDFATLGLLDRLREVDGDLPADQVKEVIAALEERNTKVVDFSKRIKWVIYERDEALSKLQKVTAENERLKKELERIKAADSV